MVKECHKQGQRVFIREKMDTRKGIDKASDETINKTDTRKGRQGQRRNY